MLDLQSPINQPTPIDLLITNAASQLGLKEQKGNKGPNVAKYLQVGGLGEGYAWCAGFVCWCVEQVNRQTGLKSKLKYSAGVLAMYNQNKPLQVTEPQRGDIFIMAFKNGTGHTGIITGIQGDTIHTIEGNTNDEGAREGDGVYTRKRFKKYMHGYLRPF